jgi:tRNA pseudouridine38-40 synthase
VRIALGVEYDGTPFCGWQRQRHSPSVQAELERAISRVADMPVTIHCAGRTDTGVHATGQVVHFDAPVEREPKGWVLGTNSNLHEAVSVRWAVETGDDFHARFSAVERRYRYLILNSRTRSALHRHRACVVHGVLDVSAMQAAADLLVGEHDFSAFRAAGCQAKTPVRDLRRLSVRRSGRWLVIDVTANAFLQHMVRNIAGLLIHVGNGDAPPGIAGEILAGRDRTRSAAAAPPDGLFLTAVTYPSHFGLPDPAAEDLLDPPLLPLY